MALPAMKVEISDLGKCVGNRYGIAIQSLSYSPLLTDEVSQSPLSEMLPIGNVKWDKPGGITWDWTEYYQGLIYG